jgi:quinone-modifying oxidoreductase subunit QmoA
MEDPSTKDVILHAEDVMNGEKIEFRADMAVLATGMVPSLNGEGKNLMAVKDEHGFIDASSLPDGMSVAGVAERPMDVMSSVMSGTAVALKNLGDGNV